LALGAGASLILAFAPFGVWPLAISASALLLWLWEGVSPRRAAWRGFLFGLGVYTTGVSWVYLSLRNYGNAPAAFAALATLLLVLYLALYPAVIGYLLGRWVSRPSPVKWLVVAPALGAGLEWVRSWLLTGFPWLSLGYSQIDNPLGNIAAYLGVFGVSWAVWLTAGFLIALSKTGRNKWMRLNWGVWAVILWVSAWSLGQVDWVRPVGKPLRVSLVQGNISQDRKWLTGQLQNTLELYARLSFEQAEGSDVIIWPETAIPIFYEQVTDFVESLAEQARLDGTDYLIGIPTGSWDQGIFHNAVVSLGRFQGFYYKHRLLPFGEYLPLRFILNFFRDFVDIPMADFVPGQVNQSLLQAAGYPVGTSICSEVMFASEIRKTLPQARFLVNVSNDAWFGDSLAPHQHLQIARMRALETGRYLARATNTGISAFIDERGCITARSNQFNTEVLRGNVQPMAGATPFARLGDGVTMISMAVLLTLGVLLQRRLADG
jgi:apolipoprotein N-acyltransferase